MQIQNSQIQNFLSQAKNKKSSKFDADFAVEIHHLLMKTYGWIPLKEFEELPIPTIINLLEKISRDYELEKKELDKSNKRINGR